MGVFRQIPAVKYVDRSDSERPKTVLKLKRADHNTLIELVVLLLEQPFSQTLTLVSPIHHKWKLLLYFNLRT